MAETWPNPITQTKHVKDAIDWVRHRTGDRVRLIIAVGVNGLAIAKPQDVQAEDAIAFLKDLEAPIAKALRQLDRQGGTSIATALPER